jgi:hypothetical protein
MPDREAPRPFYVVWSGGMDSTLVLLDAIAERESMKDTELPLPPKPSTVTVITPHVGDGKIAMERKSREKFLLTRRESVGLNLEVKVDFPVSDLPHSAQATIWAAVVPLALPARCRVAFGYILGDDVTPDIYQIGGCIKELHKLYYGDRSDVEVVFPLVERLHLKKDVVRGLRKYGVDPDSFWTCEGPGDAFVKEDDPPCGRCKPCTTYLDALAVIEAEDRRKEINDKQDKARMEEWYKENGIVKLGDDPVTKEDLVECSQVVDSCILSNEDFVSTMKSSGMYDRFVRLGLIQDGELNLVKLADAVIAFNKKGNPETVDEKTAEVDFRSAMFADYAHGKALEVDAEIMGRLEEAADVKADLAAPVDFAEEYREFVEQDVQHRAELAQEVSPDGVVDARR